MWPNRLKPIYLVGVLVIIAMIAAFACSSDDDADDSSAAPAAAPAASTDAAKSTETKAAPAAKAAAPAAKAAPAAASKAAPAAQAQEASGLGSLVGEFGGPEIVGGVNSGKDLTWAGSVTGESPEFALKVEAGDLPPVADRVGSEPIVIKPVEETGAYGGNWRRGFNGPADYWLALVCCSGIDTLLYLDANDIPGQRLEVNFAQSWTTENDFRKWTFDLREGHKWSDGDPFDSADFTWWFENAFKNDELLPGKPVRFAVNGKFGHISAPDAQTVVFEWEDPFPLWGDLIAGPTEIGSLAHQGRNLNATWAPGHYLENYHIDFNADADKNAQDEGYETWVNHLKAKAAWGGNPDLPSLTPWITTKPYTDPPFWVLERNPYSVWVDDAGNQLPYISKVILQQYESLEIHGARAVAGEYDFQGSQMLMESIPALLENSEAGNYHVRLYPTDFGSDFIIKVNLTYAHPNCEDCPGDQVIGDIMRDIRFRRALSLSIERQELNEIFWLGEAGRCGSVVPPGYNQYYPGDENAPNEVFSDVDNPAGVGANASINYENLWSPEVADYAAANALLDEVTVNVDGQELGIPMVDGVRNHPVSGDPLVLNVIVLPGQHFAFQRGMQVVDNHWKNIGVRVVVQLVERSRAGDYTRSNDYHLWAWNNDGSDNMFTASWHVVGYYNGASTMGPRFGQWYGSNGTAGVEPGPDVSGDPAKDLTYVKEIYDLYRSGYGSLENKQNGKDIWAKSAEGVHVISTCGLSAANWGVAVVNNNLGNIPGRVHIGPDAKFYGLARPQTFFYRNFKK